MAQSEEISKSESNKINKSNERILRSRHYKRPIHDNRPTKRLFTPEIKRHLKNWLIRRRENPYPNREEKLELTKQTGLTYIQICNWFANWRRKLKNSGKSISKYTWSTLIRSYNDRALGNVEHLSICSDDSIWEESDVCSNHQSETKKQNTSRNHPADHSYTSRQDNLEKNQESEKISSEASKSERNISTEYLPQCFQISSTTDFITDSPKTLKTSKKFDLGKKTIKNKFSHHKNFKTEAKKKFFYEKSWSYERIMKGICEESDPILCSTDHHIENDPLLLSKWKKSVALFQPSRKTYSGADRELKKYKKVRQRYENFHGREELDAAEALTFLSRASASNP